MSLWGVGEDHFTDLYELVLWGVGEDHFTDLYELVLWRGDHFTDLQLVTKGRTKAIHLYANIQEVGSNHRELYYNN